MTTDTIDAVRVMTPERSAWARIGKRLVLMVFTVLAFPYRIMYVMGSWVWGKDRSFLQSAEWIAGIPGMLGVYFRVAFYRMTLSRMDEDCYIGWLSTFSMPQTSLGKQVYVGRRCTIGFAEIGDRALLADGVQVLSGGNEHTLAPAGIDPQQTEQVFQRVRIGKGAWIGTNAIIMADIGEGAVIGAGAVVTKPVPPRTVAVGVPAHVIKQLS
jgi:acetyltransferase-like isoleucine patch superfamily enzyme